MCDTEGCLQKTQHRKKCSNNIKHEIFCGTGFYKRREKNYQEKKKDELSPAIGKNYINKNVSFLPVRVRTCLRADTHRQAQTGLLTFYYRCFYLSLTARNPKKISTEKGDKKFPLLPFHLFFYLSFAGRRLNHRF